MAADASHPLDFQHALGGHAGPLRYGSPRYSQLCSQPSQGRSGLFDLDDTEKCAHASGLALVITEAVYSLTNVPSSEAIGDEQVSDVYPIHMDLNARIYRARNEARMTQEQLAAATGKTRGAVSQWEKGDVRPRHSTLVLIAKATGASLQWLESGVDETSASVRMVGEVAAGIWREASLYFQQEELPIAFHPDYPENAQRAYRVIGNSTNRIVRNGEYVHTVDIHAANIQCEEGDFVIVRRLEHGKAEYTAKTLVKIDGVWWLRPESDDPAYQDDMPIKGDDGVEIEVTDLVIARWSPIARRRRV